MGVSKSIVGTFHYQPSE